MRRSGLSSVTLLFCALALPLSTITSLQAKDLKKAKQEQIMPWHSTEYWEGLLITAGIATAVSQITFGTATSHKRVIRDSISAVIPAIIALALGHLINFTSKNMGKTLAADIFNFDNDAPRQIMGVSSKNVFNVAFKETIRKAWPAIGNANGLIGSTYDTGTKLFAINELIRYLERSLHAWKKWQKQHELTIPIPVSIKPNITNPIATTPVSNGLLDTIAKHGPNIITPAVISTESVTLPTDFTRTLAQQVPSTLVIALTSKELMTLLAGTVHFIVAYQSNLIAQNFGNALQAQLSKAGALSPKNDILERFVSTNLGFAFAIFIKDTVMEVVETAFTNLGLLYNKEAQELYDALFWAGNKGPFAWQAFLSCYRTMLDFSATLGRI